MSPEERLLHQVRCAPLGLKLWVCFLVGHQEKIVAEGVKGPSQGIPVPMASRLDPRLQFIREPIAHPDTIAFLS